MANKRERFCLWLGQWEWLLLLALLPAVLIPIAALPLLFVLLPVLWLARWLATDHFVPLNPLNRPMAGLLLMVLVSMLVTPDLAFSWPKVSGLVYGVALFYGVIAFAGRGMTYFWLAVAFLLACGVGVAGLSLIGAQWPNKIPLLATLIHPLQSFSLLSEGFSPNEVGGVLLWPLLPLFALAGAGWLVGGRRWLALLLSGLSVGVLVIFLLTQSRSAWLGFGAGVGLLLVVMAGRYRRPVFIAGLLFGLLLVGLLFFAPAGADSEVFNTLSGRAEIWSRAWYAILDFPLTGLGMNMFRKVAPILYPFFFITPGFDIAHAHNHLLQTAVDLGLPGLAAYLVMWGITGRVLWQKWATHPDLWQRAVTLGVAAGLFAYFVYGLTDAVALGSRPGFIFWLLIGLAMADLNEPV